MAIVRAVKTGVWSDTTVWSTGALPTSSDDVYSNTWTVTINTSPTVLSISNAAATGVTVGGSFVPTNGMVLACTGAGLMAGTSAAHCLNSALALGQSCTIVANCTGGAGAGILHNGAGAIYLTGNVFGPPFGAFVTVFNTGTGTVDITGDATSAASFALYNQSTGTIKLTGSLTGGTGNVGYLAQGAATFNHIGPAYASSTQPAIGPGPAGQITILTGPLVCSTSNDTSAGVNPCVATRWFPADTALSTFRYEMRGATASGSPLVRPARNLYLTDAYASGYPSATNVRTGTAYGAGGSLTGTCAVPAAASVVVGAAVDATVGTAAITAATIRDAMGLASANLDAQLAAIASTAAPSVTAIRTELDTNSSKLANLDSTISSRLAASGYTTPPTAAATATATRSELATELARIDAAISSRLSPSGTLSRVTLTDTATTLTNAPEVPTAAAIASQVRTEISTELGRIDATISSRLPSVTYSSPLDASGTRNAIGLASANLDTQLARVANAATTQEVGDLISEALQ